MQNEMNRNSIKKSADDFQEDWVNRDLKIYSANMEALEKTFTLVKQAVHELTCIATRRNEPFNPDEWKGSIEDYFRAAKPVAVQWRKPQGSDNGQRTNMLYLPEFAANPLLVPFFVMLAKGPLERADVPDTFGQFQLAKSKTGIVKYRRVAWDNPDNASGICLVPEAVEIRLTGNNTPAKFRMGEPIEVSAQSARRLAVQALLRPRA
jgi:hypothetical protein